MTKLFAIVDCNNFYASCERLFRPELKDEPIVVLSNNDGCIVARSNEAKALGIGMGLPYFEFEKVIKKNNVHVFSSNYALYGDISDRVMRTLRELSPEIEIYSIDEAFLNLAGLKQDPTEFVRYVRDEVYRRVGVPVSIGIAQTKTLAKLANRISKKNPEYEGVFNLYEQKDSDKFLKNVDVGDVWGIGWKLVKFMKKYGINTAFDLKNSDPNWIRDSLSIIVERTVLELRGIPCIDIDRGPDLTNGILSSRSFTQGVRNFDDVSEAVANFAGMACEKLRSENGLAALITVFISTGWYSKVRKYSNSFTISLDKPTASSIQIVRKAHEALRRIYRKGYTYKKAGIYLTKISSIHDSQFTLDNKPYFLDKEKRLMDTVDNLNNLWGRNTLFLASEGVERKWRSRSDLRSPRYTTSWNEIPIIR